MDYDATLNKVTTFLYIIGVLLVISIIMNITLRPKKHENITPDYQIQQIHVHEPLLVKIDKVEETLNSKIDNDEEFISNNKKAALLLLIPLVGSFFPVIGYIFPVKSFRKKRFKKKKSNRLKIKRVPKGRVVFN